MGLDTIDSPYALIAADLDNSGVIDQSDHDILLALVLHIDTVIANNSSWRFVDATYEFPDPANPWSSPFPEMIALDSLMEAVDSLAFIAIKIGDINCSLLPAHSSLQSQDIEDRAVLGYQLIIQDKYCSGGGEYTAVVALPEGLPIQGGQIALQWPAGVISSVQVKGESGIDLNAVAVANNKLALSWMTLREIAHGQLLEISFRANEDGLLSNWLSVDESQFKAEFVAYDNTSGPLRLEFLTAKDQPQLFQNSPNPTRESTTISFYLPEPASAVVTVQTLTGQVIARWDGQYEAGVHQLLLQREDIPAGGVLIYTLETSGYRLARKMVILGGN